MLDVAILGQVAFGYSPFIDRNRAVSATRLTVFPLKTDSSPDAAQLLHAVGGVWPADGARVSSISCVNTPVPQPTSSQRAPSIGSSQSRNTAPTARLQRPMKRS